MYPPALSRPTPTPTTTPNQLGAMMIHHHHKPAGKSNTASCNLIEEMKTKGAADVCHGDAKCREKFALLLAEIGFPGSVLLAAVEEIEECGHVKETGFVWLKHKKTKDHYKFDTVDVRCDAVVTASFERRRIRNLTGVKAKEFLFWITLSEVHVTGVAGDGCSPTTIAFKTPAGFSKSFPLSLFVGDGGGGGDQEVKSGIRLAF